MKVVIQRVKEASVKVDGKIVGSINNGFLILLGVVVGDTKEDLDYLVKKVSNLRIFEDEAGKMNLSIKQRGYDILSISQFTLAAITRNGNRPSFTEAAAPEIAIDFYNQFNEKLREENIKVETGVFGADMDVHLVNDGPVTIIINSKVK